MAKRIKAILKKLYCIIRKPEMLILPANLAFFLVLSVVPIFILIGLIASTFSLSLDVVLDFIGENLPSQVTELLATFISGKGIDFNVGFFTITAFILASNGPHSIIVTSNTLYNFEQGSYLNRRIKAIILTILLVTLFIFIIVVLAFGNIILKAIFEIGVLKNVSNFAYSLFVYLKWPIAFFIIFFSIKLIYTIAPDKSVPSKYVNKGAIFTTLGWILTTAIYSYYVSHFSKYDIFYGSLSNIIILMMYIYFLSYILVLGIAINSNSYEMLKSGSIDTN
ncbi:MAG: YihY/virulence factor BrkB family protein [Bacilli bacterium]|nr:YihY/virulence factor BrkB family protein [Bacilli bacterium]